MHQGASLTLWEELEPEPRHLQCIKICGVLDEKIPRSRTVGKHNENDVVI